MVCSPYVPQQKICQKLVKTLQEGKRGAVGLDMADVCCVWRLYMPSGASLVCYMDPSNVLKHCHNNGWLYLFHNRKFAKSLSRLSRKEKGGAVGLYMADVCCDWRLYMPSGASLVCSMDPSNVLKHCHNNGWLTLCSTTENLPKACQDTPGRKRG